MAYITAGFLDVNEMRYLDNRYQDNTDTCKGCGAPLTGINCNYCGRVYFKRKEVNPFETFKTVNEIREEMNLPPIRKSNLPRLNHSFAYIPETREGIRQEVMDDFFHHMLR